MSGKAEFGMTDPLAWINEVQPGESAPVQKVDDGEDMKLRETLSGEVQQLELGDALRVADVMMMKEKIMQAFSDSDELILNASENLSIDGAGMQLLYMTMLASKELGKTVRWEHFPSAVAEAAEVMGMSDVVCGKSCSQTL